MRTKNQILKSLAILMIVLTSSMGAWAQVGELDKEGNMSVCVGATEEYAVPDVTTSTFTWKVDGETVSPTSDWTITPTGHNSITVKWDKVGSYVLTVQEETATKCLGPEAPITIEVNPLPEVAPMETTVCSDTNIDVTLPATDKNSVELVKYDITAVVDPLLVTGKLTTGAGIIDVDAIKNDKFTNTTGGDLTVVYRVIPYSGSCPGAEFTITVTISSGPQVDAIVTNACSDLNTDVLLPATDKNKVFTFTKYDITAVADPLLEGTPTIGADRTDLNSIKNDVFTNSTAGDLKVVYTVTPYSDSCVGVPFTITVTVSPVINTPKIYHK